MANTVVSIFENVEQAQRAQDLLRASGYADNQVVVKTAAYKTDAPAEEHENTDVFDKIADFFKDLFGADDEEVVTYSEAGHKGTIITVHTADRDEAEKVAAILDGYGAVDVAENTENIRSVQHQFLDDPANPVFAKDSQDTSFPTRASRLKSRIVARSEIKNNPFF